MRLEFALRHTHVNAVDVRMHSHPALELVYYAKGRGVTQVAGSAYPFRPGVFAVIPSGMDHDQQDKGPVTSLCFGLVGSDLEPFAGCYHDPDGGLRVVCEQALSELASRTAGWSDIVQGLLFQMKGLVQRAAVSGKVPDASSAGSGKASQKRGTPPVSSTQRKRALVENAMTIIRTRGGMVTVSELSEQLYVSHDYLRHLFQETSGASPMRHIIRTRMERAKELLESTDLPLAELAGKIGFDNPFYFSRLFKQVTGQTPSAYRKRHA